jgi:hypothetical protein
MLADADAPGVDSDCTNDLKIILSVAVSSSIVSLSCKMCYRSSCRVPFLNTCSNQRHFNLPELPAGAQSLVLHAIWNLQHLSLSHAATPMHAARHGRCATRQLWSTALPCVWSGILSQSQQEEGVHLPRAAEAAKGGIESGAALASAEKAGRAKRRRQ